jgi:hypothetical protein
MLTGCDNAISCSIKLPFSSFREKCSTKLSFRVVRMRISEAFEPRESKPAHVQKLDSIVQVRGTLLNSLLKRLYTLKGTGPMTSLLNVVEESMPVCRNDDVVDSIHS